MTKSTNPIGLVNHCYEHVVSKAKEMGGIKMSTTKEKVITKSSVDWNKVAAVVACISCILTLALGLYYYGQLTSDVKHLSAKAEETKVELKDFRNETRADIKQLINSVNDLKVEIEKSRKQ